MIAEVTAKDLFDFVNAGGVVGILLIIIVSGIKKWWVFGWQYQEVLEREQEWKGLALTGTSIAEHVVTRPPVTAPAPEPKIELSKEDLLDILRRQDPGMRGPEL